MIQNRFFNLKRLGLVKARLSAASAAIFVLAAMTTLATPSGSGARAAAAQTVSDGEINAIVETHCSACHAATPTHPAFSTPQGDLILESLDDVRANADSILLQTVESDIMPLGNETGMTGDERAALGAWLEQQ